MKTYLELQVPLRSSALWLKNLQDTLSDYNIKWQNGFYHITMAFLDSAPKKNVVPLLTSRISQSSAPQITFDHIDAFTTPSGMYIINLSTSRIPPEFQSLVDDTRAILINNEGVIQSEFKLHVTLGRLLDNKVGIEELRRRLQMVNIPPFTLKLENIDYRIFRGDAIGKWKLKN